MTKKTLNQNTKYAQELIDMIEPDFFFNNEPINRFNVTKDDNHNDNQNKAEKLSDLKRKAPNAVVIMFKEDLNEKSQELFNKWILLM